MIVKYYPVCLDVRKKPCLVVGGGAVGARKVETLIDCGAQVTVVSPAFTDTLSRLGAEGQITLKKKQYDSRDMDGVFLVIGATSNMALNQQVSRDADKINILCNIADVPDACNFILPAVVRRGDLQVAISTSGKSPAFAKHVRRELEQQFGEEYAVFLYLMGEIRRHLLAEAHEPEAHKVLFEKLIQGNLLRLIAEKKKDEINRLLKDTLGETFSLKKLDIQI
jgi:precorrin-2 dehydrogenase / sirohydrochlorin ferrochelatase